MMFTIDRDIAMVGNSDAKLLRHSGRPLLATAWSRNEVKKNTSVVMIDAVLGVLKNTYMSST